MSEKILRTDFDLDIEQLRQLEVDDSCPPYSVLMQAYEAGALDYSGMDRMKAQEVLRRDYESFSLQAVHNLSCWEAGPVGRRYTRRFVDYLRAIFE